MDYKNRIIELLRKRGIEGKKEVEQFLNPSLAGFYSPFLLHNMDKAAERLTKAIESKEKVVIYGDYDADGICAVSMLYLFLKKKGVEVFGFIPSRHHDGYGITSKTVSFIYSHYSPSLVITVDTGISAHKEIAEFNQLGVDTIVTDHHEPPQIIPSGIVVDPKISGQDYPFNGLSGAGVALKLIQAIAGVKESLEYVDICAISTIGDIVPLVDENRLITKLGLEKINDKRSRPAIQYLKSKLNITTLSSTDIAFKVVPRLNACGRMTTAEKCFHFLCETRANRLEKLYQEMEEDNNLRLSESSLIMDRIYKKLETIDFNKEPAIFVVDKEINLGLIGIIASKLCAETYRPVFIFTEDEEGRLKASIRSIEGVNIFSILDKYRPILVDVGGHSLAGGLTINKENYEKFKALIMEELKGLDAKVFKNPDEYYYDQEITAQDINLDFAKELQMLEPHGFANPKPVFKIGTKNLSITNLKSYKHYKINLEKGKDVVVFFGGRYLPLLNEDGCKKELLVNLELDTFLSRPRAKAIMKGVKPIDLNFNNEQEFSLAKDIYYTHLSLNQEKAAKVHIFKDISELEDIIMRPSHTLIVTDCKKEAEQIASNYNIMINYAPMSTGETMVLYSPTRTIEKEDVKFYYNIIFLDATNSIFTNEDNKNVYIRKQNNKKIERTREQFAESYKTLIKMLPQEGNNIMEVLIKIASFTKESLINISMAALVSQELGFINIKKDDGVKIERIEKPQKKELTMSKTYNYFLS